MTASGYKLYCDGVELHEDIEITDESIVGGGREVVLSRTEDFELFNIPPPAELDVTMALSQSSSNSDLGK